MSDRRSSFLRNAASRIAAGILFFVALWLRSQPDVDESEPVYARTQVTRHATSPSTPPAETVPDTAAQVASIPPTPEAAHSTTTAPSVSEPSISKPEPVATPVVEPQEVVTNVPPPSLSAKEPARPEFRLSGIIYTVARASAIMNGKTVFVGDQINGATVLKIGQTDVTLQIDGQQKVYNLR